VNGRRPLVRSAAVKPLLLLTLAAAALPGCTIGSSSGEPGDDDADKRGAAVTCLTEDKGLDAREEGKNEVIVGDPETGPRIVFYLTSGQAEAAQFEGDGEGAEQIGSALLFVRHAGEDLLDDVEDCLTDL
jgi:hypothetical protein